MQKHWQGQTPCRRHRGAFFTQVLEQQQQYSRLAWALHLCMAFPVYVCNNGITACLQSRLQAPAHPMVKPSACGILPSSDNAVHAMLLVAPPACPFNHQMGFYVIWSLCVHACSSAILCSVAEPPSFRSTAATIRQPFTLLHCTTCHSCKLSCERSCKHSCKLVPAARSRCLPQTIPCGIPCR